MAHNRYVGVWPNTDCNSQANWDKPEPFQSIAKSNDVTDRPGRPRISSAANARVLVRSALHDPKAPCSELSQQWQNLDLQVSTRTVNTAGLEARRRTFLTFDHRRNCVQWAANKLRWNLRTWRRIYWSDESRFLLRFTDGRVHVWR